MEEQAVVPQKKRLARKKPLLEKDSLQYNAQDMDQEQRVDVNPVQSNSQHLHIYVGSEKQDWSGKITGTTCMESSREPLKNVEILLFFGGESRTPVCRTQSDNNGNFTLDALPPGFYTLYFRSGDILRYQTGYIRVLPGETVFQSIPMKT